MTGIVHDAILFDMYYFTKPPKPNEKVESPLVTEATPQFQNFYINNIVCIGAERGIFVRGLPEMNIQNIQLNDIVLQTTKGVEIIDANNISLKNIQFNCENTKPLIYVENGSNLTFNGIRYNHNVEQLFSVNGEKSGNIKVVNTDSSDVRNKVEYSNGAGTSILKFEF